MFQDVSGTPKFHIHFTADPCETDGESITSPEIGGRNPPNFGGLCHWVYHMVNFADFFCCFSWCAAMTFMEKMHQVVVGGLAGRRTSIPRAIRHGQLSRVGDSKQLAARWPPGGPWYPYLYPFHSRTSNRLSFLVKHGFLETSGDTHLS